MKKILLFAILMMGVTFGYAQNAELVDKLAGQEMVEMERVLGAAGEGMKLNKNQKVKLEQIFLQKNKEVVLLREQDLGKSEFVNAHNKVADRYEDKINNVLSNRQRAALEMTDRKAK